MYNIKHKCYLLTCLFFLCSSLFFFLFPLLPYCPLLLSFPLACVHLSSPHCFPLTQLVYSCFLLSPPDLSAPPLSLSFLLTVNSSSPHSPFSGRFSPSTHPILLINSTSPFFLLFHSHLFSASLSHPFPLPFPFSCHPLCSFLLTLWWKSSKVESKVPGGWRCGWGQDKKT